LECFPPLLKPEVAYAGPIKLWEATVPRRVLKNAEVYAELETVEIISKKFSQKHNKK